MPETATPQPLIAAADLARRIEALGGEIVAVMGADIHMVAVLKGGFVFAADLLRALGRHGARVTVDFVHLASYGAGTVSSGRVRVLGEIPDVAGRRVLLVDDILDSGHSAARAVDLLRKAGAAEVHVCALLDKPERRQVSIPADFIGFRIPDRFVVGYGIDYAEQWRELEGVAMVADES